MNTNDTVLLADIGNTYFHIYDGDAVEHLAYDDAIDTYQNQKLYYITVKHQLSSKIEHIPLWTNISSHIKIKGEYETMGVDRKALCLSHRDGLFVDAGSAITVDVVEQGVYKGGFILPGLKGYMQTYKNISTVLDTNLDKEVNIEELPTTTKEQISYGIIASIKALIDKHSKGKKLYFTGGDGKFLSAYFKDAIYDEKLVFDGMQKVIGNK
ncbi:MAG: type III pantothenate kinase [Sulfurovum sp.]|nr:type III pantothenate kinase [Sulfurovum sp.]